MKLIHVFVVSLLLLTANKILRLQNSPYEYLVRVGNYYNSKQHGTKPFFGKWVALLEKWNLSKFVDEFDEHGWTDIKDWNEMKDYDMFMMGMKQGHIVRFKRLLKEMIENKNKNDDINFDININNDIDDDETVYAIKCVSNGYYLTTQDKVSSLSITTMTDINPNDEHDEFKQLSHWKIIKTKFGITLKNVGQNNNNILSSNSYGIVHTTSNANPNEDLSSNFKLIETNNNHVAIRSLLDGKYLDGGSSLTYIPRMTNGNFGNNPENKHSLQWTLIPINKYV